ncbi:hypothetical protein B0J18DRAFT_127930 [Chaetomium sp. MPI-SDFR-AT-0129]|nr:hypothetical protein B0J18DRAFT_127930 [Chaetomium sp. MPI-SDFR-AT-0129]
MTLMRKLMLRCYVRSTTGLRSSLRLWLTLWLTALSAVMWDSVRNENRGIHVDMDQKKRMWKARERRLSRRHRNKPSWVSCFRPSRVIPVFPARRRSASHRLVIRCSRFSPTCEPTCFLFQYLGCCYERGVLGIG